MPNTKTMTDQERERRRLIDEEIKREAAVADERRRVEEEGDLTGLEGWLAGSPAPELVGLMMVGAAKLGRLDWVDRLAGVEGSLGQNPLSTACAFGRVDCAQRLLEQVDREVEGAKMPEQRARDWIGSALEAAARNGQTQAAMAVAGRAERLSRAYALAHAIRGGHGDCVQAMVEAMAADMGWAVKLARENGNHDFAARLESLALEAAGKKAKANPAGKRL